MSFLLTYRRKLEEEKKCPNKLPVSLKNITCKYASMQAFIPGMKRGVFYNFSFYLHAFSDVNQYSNYGYARSANIGLRSPSITANKGCFTLQFRYEPYYSFSKTGRLFVFVAGGNKRTMPVWNADLYSVSSEWRRVEIELNFTNGFSQVRHLPPLFKL